MKFSKRTLFFIVTILFSINIQSRVDETQLEEQAKQFGYKTANLQALKSFVSQDVHEGKLTIPSFVKDAQAAEFKVQIPAFIGIANDQVKTFLKEKCDLDIDVEWRRLSSEYLQVEAETEEDSTTGAESDTDLALEDESDGSDDPEISTLLDDASSYGLTSEYESVGPLPSPIKGFSQYSDAASPSTDGSVGPLPIMRDEPDEWVGLLQSKKFSSRFLTALQALAEKIKKVFEKNVFEFDEDTKQFITESEKENEFLMVRSTGKEDTTEMANAGGNESVANVLPRKEAISQAIGVVVASYISEKSLTQRLSLIKTREDIDKLLQVPFMPVLLQVMIGEQENGVVIKKESRYKKSSSFWSYVYN